MMMMMNCFNVRRCLLIMLLVSAGRSDALFSAEDNALLPNLFHLDDYDRCLLQPNGLYCLGEFDLAPVGSSLMYENIKCFHRLDGVILSNGTSLIQMFVMISSFLTAYNLLLYSEKHRLSFLMLPVMVVKRIIRIAPVHLLLVGFMATYWPAMQTGVLSSVMEENSAACRQKFWAHAFFINNVVEKNSNNCLLPTWFLPVDMHLFVISGALTIAMYRRKHQTLRLYTVLFLTSAVACGLVAYDKGYRPFVYDSVPDKIRGIFQNSKSFSEFYISSWGSLPSCFMGLILAHLHYGLQQAKYDWNQNQWFKQLLPWIIPLAATVTAFMGMTLRWYRQPWVTALYLAVDRPLLICFLFCLVIGCINIDGSQRRLFSWRGWRVPARLSLPMMLCHWIASVAVSARPVAYHTSLFDVSIDYLATIFYGYAMALPLALLVEIPVQRFFAQLL